MRRFLLKPVIFMFCLLLGVSLFLSPGYSQAKYNFDFFPDKAQYYPGETVSLILEVDGEKSAGLQFELSISHLEEVVYTTPKKITLLPERVVFEWQSPRKDFTGYGADLSIKDSRGNYMTELSTAFDVCSNWVAFPRYGFVSDFGMGEEIGEIEEEMSRMAKFHLNGLQFYDWMYRHDDLVPSQDIFVDPLGRQLSLGTIKHKIKTAGKYNMASMAYTAIYAASAEFFQNHQEWGLFDSSGKPITFADDWLYLMNIEEGSLWNDHFSAECLKAIREVGFDGIHLDQYGYPETGFSHPGKGKRKIKVDEAFQSLINRISLDLESVDGEARVIFNAVNNWPIEKVAVSREDVVYIEVWPPHEMYMDLVDLINEGRRLSNGKPVVLAAYIDAALEKAIRVADAIIFSQGGYHIELGEGNGILGDPYFPNYKEMSPELERVLRQYYDFLVRFENVLSNPELKEQKRYLEIGSLTVDDMPGFDTIFSTTRCIGGYEVLNLVNLYNMGVFWNEPKLSEPPVFKDKVVKYYNTDGIKKVYWASPDISPDLKELPFITGKDDKGGYIEFKLPYLHYWSMVLFKK